MYNQFKYNTSEEKHSLIDEFDFVKNGYFGKKEYKVVLSSSGVRFIGKFFTKDDHVTYPYLRIGFSNQGPERIMFLFTRQKTEGSYKVSKKSKGPSTGVIKQIERHWPNHFRFNTSIYYFDPVKIDANNHYVVIQLNRAEVKPKRKYKK